MSLNPLLNAKRIKTTHTLAPADKSRTGELKRGGLIIHPLPTPVKDINKHGTEDILQELPIRDTPVIERNRVMRREPIEGRPSIGRRGKRASSSFENKGVIPQPHPTLDPASFHKHIDFELPEAHRARHLLVWCASRAANNNNNSNASTSSSLNQNPSSLPPLTDEGLAIFREVQKNVQKMLVEQKIEISLGGHSNENGISKDLKPHEQNVKNIKRERDFTEYIQKCKKEREAWTALVESYQVRRTSLIESLTRTEPGTSREWMPQDTSDPLYEREIYGAQLARKYLDTASRRRDKSPISLRIAEVENKVDRLHGAINVANQLTIRASRHLDKRFDILSAALAERTKPPALSEDPNSLHLVSSASKLADPPDPLQLLRALARTDMTNPGELGDTARRIAARDKIPSDRERRLTALTQPPVSTPRRPGTPRRKPDANG